MIYDCFLFNNELDLLEIRFRILHQHVDKFVLIETDITHSGEEKPFYFDQNKKRFEAYIDKIIHIKLPQSKRNLTGAWDREMDHRNSLTQGLTECTEKDLIIISDLDEIPNPEIFKGMKPPRKPVGLQQYMYYYYFNNLNITKPWWIGSVITNYKYFQHHTADQIRRLARKKRTPKIKHAGWHFSYIGNKDFIAQKIRNNAHQEYNNETFLSDDNINNALLTGADLFNRSYEYAAVPIDESFPDEIRENLKKYNDYIRVPVMGAKSAEEIASGMYERHPTILDKIKRELRD